MDKIVELAEQLYTDLYSSRENQNGNCRGSGREEFVIPLLTAQEINKALEAMKRDKRTGKDQVTEYLLKHGEQIVLE